MSLSGYIFLDLFLGPYLSFINILHQLPTASYYPKSSTKNTHIHNPTWHTTTTNPPSGTGHAASTTTEPASTIHEPLSKAPQVLHTHPIPSPASGAHTSTTEAKALDLTVEVVTAADTADDVMAHKNIDEAHSLPLAKVANPALMMANLVDIVMDMDLMDFTVVEAAGVEEDAEAHHLSLMVAEQVLCLSI